MSPKTGLRILPNEIWRVVFSFLNAKELCRCQLVCKDWKSVVISIDSTRWKQLYLKPKLYKRWKHPNWPNITKGHDDNIVSWQNLYKRRMLQSTEWMMSGVSVTCTGFQLFSRKRCRKRLCVGPNKQFKSLKPAVDASESFDSIYVYPGTYEQQSKLVIRNSVEIVGVGKPEDVILIMELQTNCSTVKFENLTLSPIRLNIRELPTRNSFLPLLRTMSTNLFMFNCHVHIGYIHIISPASASIHYCKFTRNSFLKFSHVSFSHVTHSLFETDRISIFVEEPVYESFSRGGRYLNDIGGWLRSTNEPLFISYYDNNIRNKVSLNPTDKIDCFKRKESDLSFASNNESSYSEHSSESNTLKMPNFGGFLKKDLDIDNLLGDGIKKFLKGICGLIVSDCRFHRGTGGITVCRLGNIWVENSVFCNLTYGIRCLQSSKVALFENKIYNIETTGIFLKDNCTGFIAGNDIYENGEAGIDIRSNANPIVQHNCIHNGKRSGIVCLDNGKGVIRENEIFDNSEAGIYILRFGTPKIRDNYIWSGKAAGIAITENGLGHICYNNIAGVDWAGIDIRHGANPVVSHNMISAGKSDGIVVGFEGKGVIFDNDIVGNNGCGIWVLDGAHPLIHSNRISNSARSGIAFVQDSDTEHQNQVLGNEFDVPPNGVPNRQDSVFEPSNWIMDDDFFMISTTVHHDREPESRFVFVSRPEKQYPQVEGNIISFNNGHGVFYGGTDGICVMRNQIKNNQKHGLHLVNPSEITIQENLIKENKCGVSVEPGVCCAIQENGIFDNEEYGILTAGSGIIKANDIFDNKFPCIYICSNADVYVTENRLHYNNKAALHVEALARCIINDNKIITIDENAQLYFIDDDAEPTYEKDFVIEVIEDYQNNDDETESSDRPLSAALSLTQFLSKTVEVKPLLKENTAVAPFYTAMETKRPPARQQQQVSSFCVII